MTNCVTEIKEADVIFVTGSNTTENHPVMGMYIRQAKKAGKKLIEVKDEYGPDAIAGFSSARTVNEDNYLFQKFLRAAVGTNNVDHCARL